MFSIHYHTFSAFNTLSNGSFGFRMKHQPCCCQETGENRSYFLFVAMIYKLIKIETFIHFSSLEIDAEVVTFVAGSLEAGGLPGSLEIPEVLK